MYKKVLRHKRLEPSRSTKHQYFLISTVMIITYYIGNAIDLPDIKSECFDMLLYKLRRVSCSIGAYIFFK